MELKNNLFPKNAKNKLQEVSRKAFMFFARGFFMMLILVAAAFCVFVWYRYIFRSEWDETKKQNYIKEQAKFSFEKGTYLKMIEMMESRKNKLQNFSSFQGRDIFFPEGF
jgi:LPS O-antigen subunit length determinant protein (WzzB/FepE family)